MALITCPECGRKKVSDSAEACPECGFGIRSYVIKKAEEERIKKERAEAQKKKEQRFKELSGELNSKLKEIDNTPYPEKPTVLKTIINEPFGAKVLIIIFVLLFTYGIKESSWLAIIPLALIIICIIGIHGDYTIAMNSYIQQTTDWEGDLKRKKEQLIEYYKNKDEIDEMKNKEQAELELLYERSRIRCPNCKSTNIAEITTFDKVASSLVTSALAGVPSPKILFTYECRSCRHKW